MNTQMYLEKLDQNKINFHFERFFENSGFKEKRDPLTQRHIMKLSDIIDRHINLKEKATKILQQLEGIEERFASGRGKFPVITTPSFVWNPRFGLSYAYEVKPPSVYLSEWGCKEDDLGFSSSFVIKIEIESETSSLN